MVQANLGYIESPRPTLGSMAKPGLKNHLVTWNSVCVGVHMGVCMCVLGEDRGRCLVFCSVALYLRPLR